MSISPPMISPLKIPENLLVELFPEGESPQHSNHQLVQWCRYSDTSLAILDLERLRIDWLLNRMTEFQWIRTTKDQPLMLSDFVHREDMERILSDIQLFRRFKYDHYDSIYRLKDFQQEYNWDLTRSKVYKRDKDGICTHALIINQHLNIALNNSHLLQQITRDSQIQRLRMVDRILTAREKEVLALIGQAKTDDEIGEHMMISGKTVSTHRRNLLRKLNARNKMELVRYAIHYGLA